MHTDTYRIHLCVIYCSIWATQLPVVGLLVFMLLEEYHHLDLRFKYGPADIKGLWLQGIYTIY